MSNVLSPTGKKPSAKGTFDLLKRILDPNMDYKKYMRYTPDQLIRKYAQLKNVAMGKVVWEMAMVVRALDEKKVDLTAMREEAPGLFDFLRRVAYGSVLPEVYEFQGRARQVIAQLPLPEQRRLANGGTVEFLTPGGDLLKVQPANLEPAQLRQVFDYGSVRSLAEQRVWLENAKSKTLKASSTQFNDNAPVQRKKGYVIIGGLRFTKKELLELVVWLENNPK